jgi:hypothetical protein
MMMIDVSNCLSNEATREKNFEKKSFQICLCGATQQKRTFKPKNKINGRFKVEQSFDYDDKNKERS